MDIACQSGDPCGNFALTGRKGELEVLQHTLKNLLDVFECMDKIVTHDSTYTEMLEQLRHKIDYLRDLKEILAYYNFDLEEESEYSQATDKEALAEMIEKGQFVRDWIWKWNLIKLD